MPCKYRDGNGRGKKDGANVLETKGAKKRLNKYQGGVLALPTDIYTCVLKQFN